MFKCKSEQDVDEALKPKELKQNELLDIINDSFYQYDFKKISYKLQTKTVILNFDFPKTVPDDLFIRFEEFRKSTSWNIELNQTTNMTALDNEIKLLLDHGTIKKISHHINENKVVLQLNNPDENYSDEKKKFLEKTGFELCIQGNIAEKVLQDSNLYFKSSGEYFMEQNMALAHIDYFFENEEFKPYKKSIKGKKYMELCFISPLVAKRYSKKVASLAEDTGWNIGISDSVNQNEVISLALRLCTRENISLNKNPSFNANTMEVVIKPQTIEYQKLSTIKQAFDYSTGCSLIWTL